jgi:4-diphosphocytidyl-2-C-methyl-D-erythritol kinase
VKLARQEDWLVIHAPCKVNLFLEVLGRRSDGYHDLDTVMMAVDLCDQLEFRARPDSEIRLSVQPAELPSISPAPTLEPKHDWTRAWEVPQDQNNLIVRSLMQIRSDWDIHQGMEVRLKKSIPVGAGLGGGSSNAAAAIVAGLILWTGHWDESYASILASRLGSDVNFFLEGFNGHAWCAHCTGRGEQVRPIPAPSPIHVALLYPPDPCATRQVFQSLETLDKKRNIQPVLNALASGNMSQLSDGLHNRLEGPASIQTPWIERTKQMLVDQEIMATCMTGSGSTRIALCDSRSTAQTVADRMQMRGGVLAFAASTWQSPSIASQWVPLGLGIHPPVRHRC